MNTHGSLHIEVFVEAMFQENGLLIWPDGAQACWIVDPGFSPQAEEIAAALERRGLTAQAILLTHCHPDHLAGVSAIRAKLPQVPLWAPRAEEHMLADPHANLSAQMGFPVTAPAADRLLEPGEEMTLDSTTWMVLDVGGHSPGGLAYYCSAAGVVLTGDALFAGSIGRYDFPGSSGKRLMTNIRENLLTLPSETVVYSGHGPSTTIGHEQKHNPFFH
ncbi:MAG: MBL fold metallo-hydrolase [Phycisphaerae bacterium]|jgi:glyoxylase-like metal-dependent hydrolase (beta-lactamase superfamily II)